MFYILSKDGKPLMPTKRYRHIKQLIKDGKAVKISSKPFVVQLLYDTPNVTQSLTIGVDPGRTNIGTAVVDKEGTPVFEAELVTRNREIPKLMKSRSQNRRKHRDYGRRKKRIRRAAKANTTTKKPCKEQKKLNRTKSVGILERKLPGCKKPIHCIGIKNKEARFNNRSRPAGWLTPTANQLLQTHVNLVKKIMRLLPIKRIVLEVNQFAFMALDNPKIEKWMYQCGPLYGTSGVKDAVSKQQNNHCLFCANGIEHYHHIVPRSKRGSDTIQNIAGLCKEHHILVHQEQEWADKLKEKKEGINKKYGALSVLNQIIPYLTKEYAELAKTVVTTGKDTSQFRKAYGIEKTHHSDAYCIACSVLEQPIVRRDDSVVFHLRQFRRHDRQACKQEMLNRKYLLNGKVVAINRHKAMDQEEDSLEQYISKGGATERLTILPHPATYKQKDRIMPGAMMKVGNSYKIMKAAKGRHNGKPDYYEFTDGSKATPRNCVLVKNNVGIIFV